LSRRVTIALVDIAADEAETGTVTIRPGQITTVNGGPELI
jgi:hypothetical protein